MIHIDNEGHEWAEVAQNEKTLFIVPVKTLDGLGIEYDYTNIKALDKQHRDYPLEKVVDYRFAKKSKQDMRQVCKSKL